MRAKIHLEGALKKALEGFGWEWPDKAVIEPPKDRQFGDMSVNVAMMLAKQAKKAPRAIAEDIMGALKSDPLIEKVEIAGPGIPQFHLCPPPSGRTPWAQSWTQAIPTGRPPWATAPRFRSSTFPPTPTGPLHIGHGRGARPWRLPDPDSRKGRVRG